MLAKLQLAEKMTESLNQEVQATQQPLSVETVKLLQLRVYAKAQRAEERAYRLSASLEIAEV